MDSVKTIKSCRLCDSSDIYEILNFGEMPLSNNLRDSADLDKEEFTAPLRAFQCRACGSNQLFDEVAPDILFKNYNYASPPNLRGHFEEYALTTSTNIGLEKDDLVVGIGGNNGLLEMEYQKLGFLNAINIEPAENIAKISNKNGINTVVEFFDSKTAKEILIQSGKAKLITCNNCFAHIPDLNEIVEGIKILLDPRGYFVFENAYWLNTILNLDAGQVYAEHIYYHSIKPLDIFFKKHGLEIVEIELNKVQLGSFRIYVTWLENSSYNSTSVKNLIKLEEDFGLYRADTYEKFKRDVEWAGTKLRQQLENNLPNKVALYGVPAKIVLLIKLWELEKYIDYAVDDSKIKWGKFVPGTKIPIHGSDYWTKSNVTAILIGAYNFADDIMKKYPEVKNWIIPFK